MKLTYLGTGAAEGVPAVFCNCATCQIARRRLGKELHSRSQVLIDGMLCIDFPPDAYWHSVQFGVDLTDIRHLVVTHSHMDHFYAHDFILRGYKYAKQMHEPILHIYGNSEVLAVFRECTRREMKAEVASSIILHELKAYETVLFDGYQITPLPAFHEKNEECYVYSIQKLGITILYLNDTGLLSDEVYDFLQQNGTVADLVSFDCTFGDDTRGKARHMGIGDNMQVKSELVRRGIVHAQTQYVITHFSHNSGLTQEKLAKIEQKYGVIAAYDGLQINVNHDTKE